MVCKFSKIKEVDNIVLVLVEIAQKVWTIKPVFAHYTKVAKADRAVTIKVVDIGGLVVLFCLVGKNINIDHLAWIKCMVFFGWRNRPGPVIVYPHFVEAIGIGCILSSAVICIHQY